MAQTDRALDVVVDITRLTGLYIGIFDGVKMPPECLTWCS